MMNKRAKKSHIGLAFAGITAGLIALFTPMANASSPHRHADDCNIVAKNDRPLCHTVQHQRAYGWTYGPKGEGLATNPNGYVDVHDATHQGLSKAEMHNYLLGYREQYREHVADVSVNVDTLKPGCVFTVRVIRRDGIKVTATRVSCPK